MSPTRFGMSAFYLWPGTLGRPRRWPISPRRRPVGGPVDWHRGIVETAEMHWEAPLCYFHQVMNLLRRASYETVQQLGVNVPTALMAIFGILSTIVIVATFSGPVAAAPETETVTGFSLWLIKSLAWIGAWVVVFVSFLAWNMFKVSRRDRFASAQLKMAAEKTALVEGQIKSFLRNALSDPCYGVAECYAFGSVVGRYPTRDVDIIIQFDSSKARQVRIYRDRLRRIEGLFQDFHDLKLHLQTFLSTENEALHRFLNRAGTHERIM